MGLDRPNSSFVFRDDKHRAVFGGGVGASREVKALGARAGGTNDAELSATLKDKGMPWFNEHVLHVAATDILGYLEKFLAFLEHQQFLIRARRARRQAAAPPAETGSTAPPRRSTR